MWMDWETYAQGTFWSVKLERRNGAWKAEEQELLVGKTGGGPDQVEFGFYTLKSEKPHLPDNQPK